jgi:hypothetical protein
MADDKPSRPRSTPPVIDNRTHLASAYVRTAKGKGKLERGAGLGYIGSTKSPEDIAAMFKGQPVDAGIVREILGCAVAHLFITMTPWTGSTGYFRMDPREVRPPRRIAEPDDPRDDDDELDEADDPPRDATLRLVKKD